jgi:hypothetical protein
MAQIPVSNRIQRINKEIDALGWNKRKFTVGCRRGTILDIAPDAQNNPRK